MYRKFFVALIAVAMVAILAAPAFAEPPVPGSDSATGEVILEGLPEAAGQTVVAPAFAEPMDGPGLSAIYLYGWLNLARSYKWNLTGGKSHVVSQAYNASSSSVKMIVKNKLCRGGSCTLWTKHTCSSCTWSWAGWWKKGTRAYWTTRGIHIFKFGGIRKKYTTKWVAPL